MGVVRIAQCLDDAWSGTFPFRAITDDELLRFFAGCETAGMLG
jgi:hypothetical protein